MGVGSSSQAAAVSLVPYCYLRGVALNQQKDNSGDKDKSKESSVELIISSKYPTEPLELLEEALNRMALLIGVIINRPGVGFIAFGRDCIARFMGCNVRTDCLCAISLISKDVTPTNIDLIQQRDRMLGIMVVAGTEQESKWIAQAIHSSV